jgi:hypothetical protein
MRRVAAFLAAAGAVAAIVAAPAGAATANPYTPTGVCGPGFKVIDSHDLRGPGGNLLAQTYLLWDSGSQRNCAVTIKRRDVGKSSFVEVGLSKKGGLWQSDDRLEGFQYYAGPLYVKAPGTCVIYSGGMRDLDGYQAHWITPQFGFCH